ncbi:hypothetical protein Q5752_005092 [Cryptotrichosporon argae]
MVAVRAIAIASAVLVLGLVDAVNAAVPLHVERTPTPARSADAFGSRQLTRAKQLRRLREKSERATAALAGRALRPRTSGTFTDGASTSEGAVTSSVTYATYEGWDNAYNDVGCSSARPEEKAHPQLIYESIGPNIDNVETFQACINYCNDWQTETGDPSQTCTGISYDYGQHICWVEGSAYSQYTYQTKATTISLMAGTCEYWATAQGMSTSRWQTGNARCDDMLISPVAKVTSTMANICEQINAS